MTPGQSSAVQSAMDREPVMTAACSGTGIPEIVHHLIAAKTGNASKMGFSCEKVATKRDFLMKIAQPKLGSPGCIFKEMGDLPQRVGDCAVHGKRCRVHERSDVHVRCFSCKDLSKLSAQFKGSSRDEVLRGGLGTSGKTFA
eukprot:3656166-Pyramimonas_sp.AAC.1